MTAPVREYRRVSPDEPSTIGSTGNSQQRLEVSSEEEPAHGSSMPSSTTNSTAATRTPTERMTDKIVAAVWVAVAVAVSYWTKTFQVLLHPNTSPGDGTSSVATPVTGLLQIAAIGVGINTVLVLYLTVYLPYGKGLTDSSAWPVYCPRVIPTITGTSIVVAACLVRAVWPVWGVLAPLILGIQAMGALFSLHFIPVWPQ